MSDKGSQISTPAQDQVWDQFGSQYDWPHFDGEARSYIIASSGRSGSHYLAHLLFQTGQLGSPLEYLHPRHMVRWQKELGVTSSKDILLALMRRRTGASGWFGIKSHWSQFTTIATDADVIESIRVKKFIRLNRLDTVAQAVSMVIAKQSGAWISYHNPTGTISYEYGAIEKEYKALQKEDAAWAEYFARNGIVPLSLSYEQMKDSPKDAVAQFGAFLGVCDLQPAINVQIGPQRQSTQRNAKWCRRFREEAKLHGLL